MKVSCSTTSTGRGRGRDRGRVSEQIIIAAPRNEDAQTTIVPPKNLTVAVAATEKEFALVPMQNSVELEAITQNVVADNSRDQYDTRAVGLVLWLYKNPLH